MQSHAAADEKALKKYEILGPLAKGGMAELFLARTSGLGGFERLLVIKRILPELARDTELVRMFLDEARTVASLHHSNIVHIYDVDMVDGSVFLAMEHLHGQHVAAMLARGRELGVRMPLEAALGVAIAVAAGLQYAHERWGPDGTPLDIVHRDVAPNNVIVTYDGNVKLIDFGIAKSAKNLSNTRFGLFKGKLPYAAPEQIRCEPVDRRTDVFSLGLLLYEMTTGHAAYSGDNEYELLRIMGEAVVPLPRLRDKGYSRELEAIVLKALAKDREDRYPSAQALQRDLEVLASKLELDLSSFALARYMASLFDDELNVWHSARRQGITLEQHIITRTTGASRIIAAAAAMVRVGDSTQDLDVDDLIEPPPPAIAPVAAPFADPPPPAKRASAPAVPDATPIASAFATASLTDASPIIVSSVTLETPAVSTPVVDAAPLLLEDDATRMRAITAPPARRGLVRRVALACAAIGLVLVGGIGARLLQEPSKPSERPPPVAAPPAPSAPSAPTVMPIEAVTAAPTTPAPSATTVEHEPATAAVEHDPPEIEIEPSTPAAKKRARKIAKRRPAPKSTKSGIVEPSFEPAAPPPAAPPQDYDLDSVIPRPRKPR